MKRLVFLVPALLIALSIPGTTPASDLYWWDKTEDGEITAKDFDIDFKDNPAKSLGEKQVYDNGRSPEALAVEDHDHEATAAVPVRSVTPRTTPRTTPVDVRSGRDLPSSSRTIRRANEPRVTPRASSAIPAVPSRATTNKFGWGQKKAVQPKPNPVETSVKPAESKPKVKLQWGKKTTPSAEKTGPTGGPGIH